MTALEVYKISAYFQFAGGIAVAICCLLHFTGRSQYIRVLGIYATISIFFTLQQQISSWFFGNAALNIIGNTYTLLEAWVLSWLFFVVMKCDFFKKRVMIAASLYTIFYTVSLLFFLENFYSNIRFGRDLLMIGYALIYFYYLIQKLPDNDLLKSPMFWINAAVIFFFSGTFVLSLVLDYLIQVLKNDLTGFWAFRNFFRFGFCLVLAYAGWLDWRLVYQKERTANNPVNS